MSSVLPWGARLTIDDLDRLPDDGHRYELVDGSLLVTPAPSPLHQRAVFRVAQVLDAAVAPGLDVLPAPVNYIISAFDVPQPDVIVARRAHLTDRGVEGTALLVIEVLSPGTRPHDLGSKRLLYEAAGVPAYWIIDPDEPSATVLELRGNRYTEAGRVVGDDAWHDARFDVTVIPSQLTR